jgi:hypothetical protein
MVYQVDIIGGSNRAEPYPNQQKTHLDNYPNQQKTIQIIISNHNQLEPLFCLRLCTQSLELYCKIHKIPASDLWAKGTVSGDVESVNFLSS